MLDDEQIERYSRQLILQEVGPRGQERLGTARIAVVGTGIAAERVVAYLAAAGVGTIAADPALAAAVDPAQPDCTFVTLAAPGAAGETAAVVVVASSADTASEAIAVWAAHAPAILWIADGLAGAIPPCPRCAAVVATASAPPPGLAAVRDAFLGTVVATEVVKTILAIGTPLSGHVLTYDPATATVVSTAAETRPGCACGAADKIGSAG
jgi:ThiF family protein